MKVDELFEAAKKPVKKPATGYAAYKARQEMLQKRRDAAKAKRGKIEINQGKVLKEINRLAVSAINGASAEDKRHMLYLADNDTFWDGSIDFAVHELNKVFNDPKHDHWGSGVDEFEQAANLVAEKIVDYYSNRMNFGPGEKPDLKLSVDRDKFDERSVVAAIKRAVGKDITKESVELSEAAVPGRAKLWKEAKAYAEEILGGKIAKLPESRERGILDATEGRGTKRKTFKDDSTELTVALFKVKGMNIVRVDMADFDAENGGGENYFYMKAR